MPATAPRELIAFASLLSSAPDAGRVVRRGAAVVDRAADPRNRVRIAVRVRLPGDETVTADRERRTVLAAAEAPKCNHRVPIRKSTITRRGLTGAYGCRAKRS